MKRRRKKKESVFEQLLTFSALLGGVMGSTFTDSLMMGAALGAGTGIGLCIAGYIVYTIRRGVRLFKSNISDIDKMTGVQFEEYLKILFTNRGYQVSLTPGSGDYGADLILKKDKEIIAVQAKRYRQSVGVKAVQEVIPSINVYNANSAWVVTNSVYTRQAMTLAKHNNVRMIDRKELVKMIVETRKMKAMKSA